MTALAPYFPEYSPSILLRRVPCSPLWMGKSSCLSPSLPCPRLCVGMAPRARAAPSTAIPVTRLGDPRRHHDDRLRPPLFAIILGPRGEHRPARGDADDRLERHQGHGL